MTEIENVQETFLLLQNCYETGDWEKASQLEDELGKYYSTEDVKIVVGRTHTRAITLSGFAKQDDGTYRGPWMVGYFEHGRLVIK